MRLRVLVLAGALLGAGCLISEQQGELLVGGPQGDGTLGDITLHFDSTNNKALLYGRSGLLALLALGVAAAERGTWKKSMTLLLGVPALAGAGWLWTQDAPTLKSYRIQILNAGLFVQIPPAEERRFSWQQIEGMTVLGQAYPRLGPGQAPNKSGAWKLATADWKTLDLKLQGGESFVIDLTPLSIEHRQTLFLTIARRAQLAEQ